MTRSLTLRELNRALLARQLLLKRTTLSPLAVIEHLVGLQAQVPRPPFVGLWTRLARFARADLHALIHARQVVRATMMRGTIHLMSARDYLALRPLLTKMLTAGMKTILGTRVDGLDVAKLTKLAATKLPATFETLRGHLVKQFTAHDERALGYAVRMHLPLVLVPTDTRWGYPANAQFAHAETWLGATLAEAPRHELVRRYLGAFGPASVRDAQAWSGMRDLGPTFEAMRSELVSLADPDGRELFDLPNAPRPGADVTPAVRYITEYDNLLLGHADRRRIIDDAHRKLVVTNNGIVRSTYLVDGMVAGLWGITRAKAKATLTLTPFRPIPKAARTALEAEGDTLVRWVEDDATSFAFQVAKR